jgi:hypothetical protein
MEPDPRQSFEPAGAGALLLATTGVACVGIPAGTYAVYRRYRGYFT